MKPTDADRDPAFERLIARGLEGETDVSGRACPDADLLAAWFDRSLSKSEAERIETHAAGCGSCQQILADLARSEPEVIRAAPVPAPTRPWHWHWRWLVPVTTAAIVIVAIGSRTLRAPQPLTISSRESVAESVSPAPAAADAAAQLTPAAPAEAPAEASRKADAPLPVLRQRRRARAASRTRPRPPPAASADARGWQRIAPRLRLQPRSRRRRSSCRPGPTRCWESGRRNRPLRSPRRRRCGPKRTSRLRLRPARPRRRLARARPHR